VVISGLNRQHVPALQHAQRVTVFDLDSAVEQNERFVLQRVTVFRTRLAARMVPSSVRCGWPLSPRDNAFGQRSHRGMLRSTAS
jgi:hypothetical protein